MGIRIDGNNDLINAADGSLTVEGLSIDVTGIVTASGGYKVGSAYTVFSNGNVATAGVVTSTTFVGALTGTASGNAVLTGSTNNQVVTVTGANAITGESGLTFDGNALAVTNSSSNTAATFQGAGGAGFIGIKDGDDSTIAYIGVDAGILKFQTSGSSYSDKLTITTGGDINVASAATIKANGNATFSGIVTAASFIGDGSGLSGVTATTINNNANNRVITGSGSANTLEAESNMTFTGSILTLTNSSGASELTLVTPSANDSGVYFNDGTNSGAVTYNHADDSMRFRVGTQERLRITGVGGSVGINEDAPLYELVVSPVDSNESQIQILAGGNGKESNVLFGAPDDADVGSIKYDHNGDHMKFTTAGNERMRITNSSTGTGSGSSSVRIGTTSAIHHADDCLNVLGGGDNGVAFVAKSNGNGAAIMAYSNYNAGKNYTGQNQSGSTTFSVTGSGAVSKASGSFRIDHPLVGMSTSHYLQHSFIEGPQADLIYRGVVTLSSGVASINIDTVSGMTEGTFVGLCTDVSCFTSNESDWTPVKGSVSGNVLTITAQDNTSTATVSWLVIGERQDDHMKDGNTNWTNSDGKVIVEILKTDVD